MFIRYKTKEIEPNEVLLDDIQQRQQLEIAGAEFRIESPLSDKIIKAFFFFFLLAVAVFFIKTFQLQILNGRQFSEAALRNSLRISYLRPLRGVIYDSNQKQLVLNKPSFDLMVDKRDISQDIERTAHLLSTILGISSAEVKEIIESSDQPIMLVAENLDNQSILLFEKSSQDLPGFWLEKNTVREYPAGQKLSHVLGYTARISKEELSMLDGYDVSDYIGKSGLEFFYEDLLRGTPGRIEITKDAKGRVVGKKEISLPIDGQSLVLWLDFNLQEILYRELSQAIRNTGSKGAAAVALDPLTGGVLAMVSLPSFDPNLFSQGMSREEFRKISENPSNPLFNRAIAGVGYPTGSVIKPLIGLAALEEGIIEPETWIFSPLKICVQNPWYKDREDCYSDWKYHGWTDIKRAIAESVNTFFYQVGGGYEDFQGLGVDKIKKWLKEFWWGRETGIDLPNEGKGIMPDTSKGWRLGDTYHLSIGQGPFAVTPLQVATAFEAIANGGKVIQPRLVKAIVNNEGELISEFAPKVLNEIPAKKENIEVIRQAMRQTVTEGSATGWLDSLPVKVAAKTGTAQTGKEGYFHNWVTVFGPYENPKIVLTIVIEEVRGEQVAALPVAKNVLQQYFRNR